MNTLFMHCRPGFEGEVCSEISDLAAQLNVAGYAKAKAATACAEFVCTEEDGAERLMRGQRFANLIFPRQWAPGIFIDLPESDRISVLLAHLADFPTCGSLWLEVVDTNDGSLRFIWGPGRFSKLDVSGHIRTMAGMNLTGKGWYSAQGNSVFPERLLRILRHWMMSPSLRNQ